LYLDAVELLVELRVEDELVLVRDLAPLWLLGQHAHLAARQRLERAPQLLVLDALQPTRFLNVPSMFPQSSLNVPSMFSECSLNVPRTCTYRGFKDVLKGEAVGGVEQHEHDGLKERHRQLLHSLVKVRLQHTMRLK
jgi:hypothetical protein